MQMLSRYADAVRRWVVLGVLVVAAGCAMTGSVREPLTGDAALAHAVQTRLRDDPMTARANLGVEADDGVVTLIGRLDSKAMRLRAVSVVQGTPGVRGVIDKTFSF